MNHQPGALISMAQHHHYVPNVLIQLAAHLTCIDHNAIFSVLAESFFLAAARNARYQTLEMNIKYC